MKRISLIILAVAAIIAGSVSCQKVNDLDKRLTQLEQTVSDLKAQILAGAVITSVDKTDDGCTFTLSNGQSYTVTNGKNGSDGEAIIADVKIEEDFVVLTLKNGETLRISYQNPLSMVTLSIVPDYDDGTVREPNTTEDNGEKSTIFYLDIEVTPAKYTEILSDAEKFIHKAVFSPVQTKSGFGNAVTVSPKSVTYAEGAPIPFLEASFELDDDTAALLQNKNTPYTVSYSIEDKDGVHGAATAFVTISNDKGSGGDNPTDNVVPEGALPGVFTVSDPDGTPNSGDEKKVHFSQGNLWYGKVGDAQTATFNFEANQYDSTPSADGAWDASHVSHFFWSKTEYVAYAASYSESGTAGSDVFFTNATTETAKSDFTVNGVTGQYRTLSKDEWTYLFDTRTVNGGTGEGKSYQRATINSDATSVYGVILYPDNYTLHTGAPSYTSTEWTTMEENGCAFLPAAGYRIGSHVYDVGDGGYYWSSTALGEFSAYSVSFISYDVYPDFSDLRYSGFSVRLITESK